MYVYHPPIVAQPERPCFAILHRTSTTCRKSDFRGELTFEDWELCSVDISVGIHQGQDYLRATLRPPLAKTPIGALLPKARRYFAGLHRTQKRHGWESGFKGWLLRSGRLYEAGVRVCRDRNNQEYLALFLRLELSKTPGTASALEVVKT
jgi:hypothetical protein